MGEASEGAACASRTFCHRPCARRHDWPECTSLTPTGVTAEQYKFDKLGEKRSMTYGWCTVFKGQIMVNFSMVVVGRGLILTLPPSALRFIGKL